MAAKGKAAKSATGASMSKYDVEVEKRLQALEKQAHPMPTGATQKSNDDRLTALENKIQELQTHASVGSGGGSTSAELQEIYAWYNRVKRLI